MIAELASLVSLQCRQSLSLSRKQENSDMLGGVGHEMRLMRSELWRRFTSRLPLRSGREPDTTVVNVASASGSRSPY